jgi:hypothetical protein
MDKQEARESQSGGVTLGHLFMLMGFAGPAEVVIGDVHRAGGGILRYLIGIPFALALGALTVWILWSLGKFFYIRSLGYSERILSGVALGVYALDLLGIIGGMLTATKLAAFLIKRVG